MSTPRRIVFITGMSGGGKATALRALEDMGFFCIDNLPVPVIPRLLDLFSLSPDLAKLAFVVDAREIKYLGETPRILQEARARGNEVRLMFIDASDEVLVRRFSETRRRHPRAPTGTVMEGIAAERALLSDLRAMADEVIDSSQTNVHELKALVNERFAGEQSDALVVNVTSFGFRHGLPAQADIVLDVRFLPNPHFVPELRLLPGTDPRVSGWVLGHDVSRDFVGRMSELLQFLIPRYRAEGKAYLTVALGCTGGRHRSVALTEALGRALGQAGFQANIRHRDVERE